MLMDLGIGRFIEKEISYKMTTPLFVAFVMAKGHLRRLA